MAAAPGQFEGPREGGHDGGAGGGRQAEADLAAALFLELRTRLLAAHAAGRRAAPTSVGVITFYKAQVPLLRRPLCCKRLAWLSCHCRCPCCGNGGGSAGAGDGAQRPRVTGRGHGSQVAVLRAAFARLVGDAAREVRPAFPCATAACFPRSGRSPSVRGSPPSPAKSVASPTAYMALMMRAPDDDACT